MELDTVYSSWGEPQRAAEWERKRPGALEPALRRAAQALSEDPDNPVLLRSYAYTLSQLRHYREAEGAWRQVLAVVPGDRSSYSGLGSVYANLGEWKNAAAAFAQSTKSSAFGKREYYRWATLCFYTNDIENYRRACRMMLSPDTRPDARTNNNLRECAAKACALAPGFGGDPEQVMKPIDITLVGTEADPLRKWFEITKALVDYRAGRFGPAADRIAGSAPSGQDLHRDALRFSILAMAKHRLGKDAEARTALASAQRIIATKMPKPEKGETFGDDWLDWLHAQILCREAEQVLKDSPASTQKSE
jgi:tetratricopeptide (TPR) repeat protein